MRKVRNKPQDEPKEVVDDKNVNKPPVWDQEHLHSFKDQAIEVLNYLDSIGEGIYEEGRYGGMYLHQFPGSQIPRSMKKKLSEQKQKEEPETQSDDIFKKMFGKNK